MLSGKVPFQPKQYTNQSALGIMKSIMQGEVSFKGEEWNGVSLSAKELIQGSKDYHFSFFCNNLLVSPLTQASTQRYRYTNHPGQQNEIHY